MLGNVSEMTSSFYRIEYYQGRMGGFVSRGGNYFTSKAKIRSSMREEIPFYKNISGDINPARQKTLGLRLVISSQIYASRGTSKKLAAAWDDYAKARPTPVLPAQSTLPTVARTNVQLDDALKSLERLVAELNNMPNVSQTVLEQLGILNASFKGVESTVKKAENDSAFAWVKTISETAYLIYSREMKELPGKQKALDIANDLGKTRLIDSITKQINQKKQNIKDGLNSYGFGFMQLEKIQESSINEGFDKYRNFLIRRNASASQIKMTELVKKHYKEYFKNRRLNIEKWKADLENF